MLHISVNIYLLKLHLTQSVLLWHCTLIPVSCYECQQ